MGRLTLLGAGKAAAAAATTVAFDTVGAGPTFTFSNSNKTATGVSGWASALADLGQTSGKRYAEIVVTTAIVQGIVGIAKNGFLTNNFIGSNGSSAGIKIKTVNTFTNTITINNGMGASWGSMAGGDVVGLTLDIDAGKCWAALNNNYNLLTSASDPVTATGPWLTWTPGGTWYPGVSALDASAFTIAADGVFTYSPPSGSIAWNA